MIIAENVGVTIDGHSILQSVSFRVAPGESVLLLGSNGAGKSTLMRTLVGMQRLSEGVVSVQTNAGKQIANLPAGESSVPATASKQPWRLTIGYVPQRTQLVGNSSVLTNVVHGFSGHGWDWRCCYQWLAPSWMRDRAMNWLAAVGLASKALQSAGSLSGGEAQRCLIARALVREPGVVLADEPTASLDPQTRREIVELLLDLTANRETALVMSSHIVSETLRRFDRVVALRGGELALDQPAKAIELGDLGFIYDHPQGESQR